MDADNRKKEGRRIEFSEIQKRARRKITPRKAVTAAAVLLLAAMAVGVFINAGTQKLFTDAAEYGDESFVYEMGSRQAFCTAGNGLAIASSTGLQLMDAHGNTVARQVFSMDVPAAAASDSYGAFYDIGGTALYTADFEGNCTDLSTGDTIISVTVNRAGFMAVATEDKAYRGRVTVYDAAQNAVYAWYSGSGYLMSAAVSPSGENLAVLCANAGGSQIHFYSLSSETQRAVFEAKDELLLEIGWFGEDRLCAISETRAVFLDGDGALLNCVPFEDGYLSGYSLSGADFLTVYLGKYRSGGIGTLMTADRDGELLASVPVERELLSLSAQDRRLLVLYSDGLELCTRTLEPVNSYSDVLGVRQALLRPDGDALLICLYSAELLSF